MPRTALALSVSVLSLGACTNQEARRAEPAPAPSLAFRQLGSLPIEGEIPTSAQVDDSTRSAGFPSVMVYGTPTTFIFGGGDLSDVQPTLERAKTREARQVNGFQAWTREDRTADGWILEGTGEAMIDKQPLYAVAVRRTIGGAPYDCTTNTRSKQEVAAAEQLCASLRAVPR